MGDAPDGHEADYDYQHDSSQHADELAQKLRAIEEREAKLYGREQALAAREEIIVIREATLSKKEQEEAEKEKSKQQEESHMVNYLRRYGEYNPTNDNLFSGIRNSMASLRLFGDGGTAQQQNPASSGRSSTLYPSSFDQNSIKMSEYSSQNSFRTARGTGGPGNGIDPLQASHVLAEGRTAQNVDPDEGVEYPSSIHLAFITTALCLSVFCMALDNTIIATAIPRITDQFHSSNDIGWYGSAYLLTQCSFQLLSGKLYTFFPLKWMYLAVLGIFEIGSAVCGAAPNSKALIVGRAIAGLGASGLFSGGMLIVASAVPLKKRPAYVGLIGGVYGIASVAGPLMGGAFTDSSATWRWCFYINLPIGLVTALFILFFYRPKAKALTSFGTGWKAKFDQLDVFGTLTFLPTVICVLLALQWGGTEYPWSSGRIIALFVMFGVLLIAFIAIQFWKGENATVPPRVLAQRSIAAGSWFMFCLGGAFVLFTYFLPIWFQAIKGSSPVTAGLQNIPMMVALVITTMVSGVVTSTWGYYTPFFLIASVFVPVGAGLISTFNVGTGTGEWIGYEIILGIGVGCGIQQMLVAVQVVLPEKDVPTGTALVLFFQNFGGSLFLSVAQNIFSNKYRQNLINDVPQVNAAEIMLAGATGFRTMLPPELLDPVRQAYALAMQNVFYVGVAMGALSFFGALFIEWKSVKVTKKD